MFRNSYINTVSTGPLRDNVMLMWPLVSLTPGLEEGTEQALLFEEIWVLKHVKKNIESVAKQNQQCCCTVKKNNNSVFSQRLLQVH